MADTEQDTRNEEPTAAEEPAGAENTGAETEGGAEAVGEADPPAAAEPADTDDAPAAAEPADTDDAPVAEEPVGDEEAPAAAAEQPAAAEEAPAAEAAGEAAAASPAPQHTYEELKGKTVAQMREIAEGLGEHDALHGYTTMHKEELLVALCAAMGIEAHDHHVVVGIDKTAVKSKIRDLKKQRDALVVAKDSKQLKQVRARIRRLKRKIHKATV